MLVALYPYSTTAVIKLHAVNKTIYSTQTILTSPALLVDVTR